MKPESAGMSLTEAIAVLPVEVPADAEAPEAAAVVAADDAGAAVLLEAQAAQASSAAPEPAITVRRGQDRAGAICSAAAEAVSAGSVVVWAIIDMVVLGVGSMWEARGLASAAGSSDHVRSNGENRVMLLSVTSRRARVSASVDPARSVGRAAA